MNDHPCCGLEARRRAVRGCIAEPAFGYVLERFQFGWGRFPRRLKRYLTEWSPYLTPRNLHLAVCADDPWPSGVLDGLRNHHPIITLDAAWLGKLMREAERILETRLSSARPHLMAFLAQHGELRSVGLADEVAAAWAMQFARDQLLKAELMRQHLAKPDPWDQPGNPIGTLVYIDA